MTKTFPRYAFLSIMVYFSFLIVLKSQESQPYGQLANSQSVSTELSQIILDGPNKISYGFGNFYKGIQGHPFYHESWKKGRFCLSRNMQIVNNDKFRLKFDAYKNELWILSGKDSVIANSREIRWFELSSTNGQEVFHKYPEESIKKQDKFYLKLWKGNKFLLVKDVHKKLEHANYIDRGMYSTGSQYDKLVENHEYFLSSNGQPFIKIRPTVKSLKKHLSDAHQKKCENFCRKKRWRGKLDETQMVAILTFLETEE